jgi:hypothetical protein
MSISSQEMSPRLFPQSDISDSEIEAETETGLLPTIAPTPATEDSRLFAERIWRAVERDVRLVSHPASAGAQKQKRNARRREP